MRDPLLGLVRMRYEVRFVVAVADGPANLVVAVVVVLTTGLRLKPRPRLVLSGRPLRCASFIVTQVETFFGR